MNTKEELLKEELLKETDSQNSGLQSEASDTEESVVEQRPTTGDKCVEAIETIEESIVDATHEYEESQQSEGISVKILTDMQRDIETLRREKTEQEEHVLRVQAEMQNVRRRVERDVENAHKFALEKFVQDLLPVVDSLDRGVETVPEDDEAQKAAREGLVLTQKMLMDSLAKFSVEVINPTGKVFDPQFHEAITMVPNPDVEPNTVIDTVQKGYTLSGRLVRPAMVVVSKA